MFKQGLRHTEIGGGGTFLTDLIPHFLDIKPKKYINFMLRMQEKNISVPAPCQFGHGSIWRSHFEPANVEPNHCDRSHRSFSFFFTASMKMMTCLEGQFLAKYIRHPSKTRRRKRGTHLKNGKWSEKHQNKRYRNGIGYVSYHEDIFAYMIQD